LSTGRVLFVGCGPGAPDLLTLRAVRALERADIVIWNATLLDRATLDSHAREHAQIVEWPPATQRDIFDAFDRARRDDLCVVRLKGGDPTLFARLEPELSAVRERGLACEIVPGVSALAAGAAALGREVATGSAPLLLLEGGALAGGEAGAALIAVYGGNRDPQALQSALLERGIPAATGCVVAIDVSRRDELLVSCPLEELAETLQDMAMGSRTLVFCGDFAGRVGGLDVFRTSR
jgi:precorrin-4 methylase